MLLLSTSYFHTCYFDDLHSRGGRMINFEEKVRERLALNLSITRPRTPAVNTAMKSTS
jgi:hypothetical protein